MKLRSVRFKISVLYTGVLGLILVAYSTMLYVNLSYVVYHEVDKNLKKKASEVGNIIASYSEKIEPDQEHTPTSLKRAMHLDEFEKDEFFQWPSIKRLDLAWKGTLQSLGLKQDYIAIYYPNGELIEKSNNIDDSALAVLKKNFKNVRPGKVLIGNVIAGDQHLRVIEQPFYRWGRVKYVIQLATSIEPILFILKSKLMLILITIPLFLIVTSFLGRFFVIRAFQPVTEITQTARAITGKDMSKRVELKHADEEIKGLVHGFNDMISRLEKSFKYIEEFSSNVAHELKTPLAIIRGELEVALRKERNTGEYRKAIGVGLDEAQRMLKTVNDLLLLAKLDYRTEVFKFEEFDLVEFLKEIYEQSKIVASEKDIAVSIDAPAEPMVVFADRLHLRRLFFNLIDNAIKFTPPQGKIDIALRRQDNLVLVTVCDTGVGIAEEDMPKIFTRFFHVDRTGQAGASTTGLGLSIAQSIARIHSGSIDVQSERHKGTTFTTTLPLITKI